MTPNLIALSMFGSMLVLLFSGQRMFGMIGFVAVVAAWRFGATGAAMTWPSPSRSN